MLTTGRCVPMLMPSIDRLATVYLFQPVRRTFATSRQPGIPILMYHSISEEQATANHPYFLTNSCPQVFAEHMRFLHNNGYEAVSLTEAIRCLEAGQTSPKSVVLTFDDGYDDFYTSAYPVMNLYGFSATVFLPTDYIGNESRSFNNKRCLTWRQVRELHRAGVAFGSHTVTHPQLRSVGPRELAYEVRHSKETLENELGSRIEAFCYPYAFPEHDVRFRLGLRSQLEESGYKHGVCTILGVASKSDDTFFLKRLPVSSRDDCSFLQAKLEGGYDWLHRFQYATKFLKDKLR
jgi:peptidoglycan/xylan/chitin deacetylase (PgdA/CDA1 family)